MSADIRSLIGHLRSPNYREQAAAADKLGELADPAAEEALLDSLWGRTYRLIDEEGSPGRYHAILSSAARALARLNTDRAFDALVSRIRSSPRTDQLGVAAAVFGLSFSPRPDAADVIRAVTPQLDADSGEYLAREIEWALDRISGRAAGGR